MKIGDSNFNEAVAIITTNPSEVSVSFNVPINDNYGNVYPILINKAAPCLISNLIRAGFTCGVCSKGVYVEKF